MIRRPPRSTLFPYTDALPIFASRVRDGVHEVADLPLLLPGADVVVLSVPLTDATRGIVRSEEHTSELQSRQYLVCRLLLEKKKHNTPLLHVLSHDVSSGDREC